MGQRRAVHTADMPIQQKPDLVEGKPRAAEIVEVDKMPSESYADELAFMEEPVTVRIEPSNEKNAPAAYPFWVNGKGCEVWNEQDKRWHEMVYIPVGIAVITKRKYVAVMAGAKSDSLQTKHDDIGSETINNRVVRTTSALATFSVLEDNNPRGAAWLTELRRRNF